MTFRMVISASIALGLSGLGQAAACEFHGAGFGPPGAGWGAYYSSTDHYSAHELTSWAEEQVENAERKTEAELFERKPVPRPTFSNAAIRAADTAKSRLRLTIFQRRIGLGVIDTMMLQHASNSYGQAIRQ